MTAPKNVFFFHFWELFLKFKDFSMILKQIWISVIFQEVWEPRSWCKTVPPTLTLHHRTFWGCMAVWFQNPWNTDISSSVTYWHLSNVEVILKVSFKLISSINTFITSWEISLRCGVKYVHVFELKSFQAACMYLKYIEIRAQTCLTKNGAFVFEQ